MLADVQKQTRLIFLLVLAGCIVYLGWLVLQRLSAAAVWDDALMFVRYARNLLATGAIAWNPDGAPTYGLTSNLYMLVVVLPLHVLNPGTPGLTLWLASLLSGLIFFVLISVLVLRCVGISGLVIIAIALLTGVTALAEHLTSGMDTMFALAAFTGYLLLAQAYERQPQNQRAMILGIWGGLLFSVRPDLMIYAVVVPAFLFLGAKNAQQRTQALTAGIATIVVLAAQLLFGLAYFGFMLPLPFYAKSAGIYGDQLYKIYYLNSLRRFQEFLVTYLPLFGIIGFHWTRNWRRWSQITTPLDKAITVGTVLFIAYYVVFVTHIMGNGQRFFQPLVPALIFLAARSLPADLVQRFLKWPLVMIGLAGLAIFFNQTVTAKLVDSHVSTAEIQARHHLQFDLLESYRTISWTTLVWPELDAFSALPDDLVIATSDVGYPGILNPHKRIIDLGALNDPALIRSYSADVLFSDDYQPDLLYMPFSDYSKIVTAIEAHPFFQSNYEYFEFDEGLSTPGIAVRRDSRYYDDLKKILAADT